MIGLALIAGLLGPTPDANTVEKARALYSAGGEAFERGRYLVAIEAFRAARALVERPAVTFTLGQACRLQYFVDGAPEHLTCAVDMFKAYLAAVDEGGRRDHAAQHLSTLAPLLERRRAEGQAAARATEVRKGRIIVTSSIPGATARVGDGDPAEIPATFMVEPGPLSITVSAPEHVSRVVETVAVAGEPVGLSVVLQPEPARVEVIAPAGARIFVDGLPRGVAPLAAPLEIPAGVHGLGVLEPGYQTVERRLELDRGEALRVKIKLPVSTQRTASYALMGIAGVLAAGGGVSAVAALEKQDQADEIADRQALRALTLGEVSRYRSLEGERDDRANLAAGLVLAASGALVTGVLLWLFDTPEPPTGMGRGPE